MEKHAGRRAEFTCLSSNTGRTKLYVHRLPKREESRVLIFVTVQGGAISVGLQDVSDDEFFRVTFQPASSFGIYCTALFSDPPDDSVCEKTNVKETLFNASDVVLDDYAYQVDKQNQPYHFVHVAGSHKGTKRSENVVPETLPVGADG